MKQEEHCPGGAENFIITVQSMEEQDLHQVLLFHLMRITFSVIFCYLDLDFSMKRKSTDKEARLMPVVATSTFHLPQLVSNIQNKASIAAKVCEIVLSLAKTLLGESVQQRKICCRCWDRGVLTNISSTFLQFAHFVDRNCHHCPIYCIKIPSVSPHLSSCPS